MGVLKTVLDSGIDVEVNSGGELFKALRIGFRPHQISSTAPAKATMKSMTRCAPAFIQSTSIPL